MKEHKRVLASGRDVDVGRNHGVRKVCRCPKGKRSKCRHAWHFNFAWKGQAFRLSLGRHIETRSEAELLGAEIREAIRAGRFRRGDQQEAEPERVPHVLTFREFATEWATSRGYQLARARDNEYRLKAIVAFVLPGTNPRRRSATSRRQPSRRRHRSVPAPSPCEGRLGGHE